MSLKYIKNFIIKFRNSITKNKRNIELRKLYKCEYKSLNDFFNSELPKTGIHTIWFDKTPLDLLFQFKSKDKPLVVFFHGAVDQSRTAIPHFVGLSYHRLIDANLLHVSDPSLIYSEDIRTAWYLGCNKIKLQKVMQELIVYLSDKIETNKIILFGSSGGGYPALYLSQVIPNSFAIVNSPATSVLNHPHRSTRVSKYLNAAFRTNNIEEEEYILDECVVSDMQTGFDEKFSSVLYMVNINDHNNIKYHSNPFFKQFDQEITLAKIQLQNIGNINIFTDNWGDGHSYPPARILIRIFTYLVREETHWENEEFREFLGELLSFS